MAEGNRSTEGRILGSHYTVTFTPEVLLWLNSDSGKKYHRKVFFKKLENLLQDISQFGRPVRGRAKPISTVETPVFTFRLENDQGIRVLFDFATHEGYIDLWILAVSEKKEFQDKLKRSAEHIVHASAFDRLPWSDDDNEMIDLAKCTNEELEELRKRTKLRFGSLPAKEQAVGWSAEDFERRKQRATIYDFVIPNIVDYSILKEVNDFELPPILKLQDHQKELMNYSKNQFLLEGVAGTGKTTILLYRFVNDIKNLRGNLDYSLETILFVTHNERLKRDIITSLKLFFPSEEYVLVSKRVKTTRELFFEHLGRPEEANPSSPNTHEDFLPENELSRERFRRMFDKNDIDIDLFWEEYRGILRGYNLRGESAIITKKEYIEIGRRRGRIRPDQRDAFYHLAKERQSHAKTGNSSFEFNKSWDSLSLCRKVLAEIEQKQTLQKIDCMYVDEVQDLTKAEMEILLLLLKPDGAKRFAVAGDLSQSIQPSSFTWQALQDIIYAILNIKVDKHDTLLENFRSTPYLVQAANRILELQDELDHESTPELQRPFAGENTGEPGHIFFENEDSLLEALRQRNLPNAACPLLVRDDKIRSRLKQKLANNSNIITIAQFKGLERRNILLWEPDSGSERVLNLRYNPVRGEFARKREYSDSTALLELRHVFVGFTRARYMMGILAPQHHDSYFMKHLLTLENNGLQDSELDKMQLFEEELSPEALLDYAREYEDAGMFEQAAEAYRNIGDEHKYEHCKGKSAIEEQEYDEAIHHLYRASKVTIGVESEKAGILISEISTTALDFSIAEKRPETIAKILMGAVGLSHTAIHRLKAEQDEERGNWNSAAKNYIQAGDLDRAAFCIRKIDKHNLQTVLYIECNQMDLARDAFKKYSESSLPQETAVMIALGDKNTIRRIFIGPLSSLKKSFESPDMGWAKSIATGNIGLLNLVRERGQLQILNRVNSSESQEREVLQLLTKTNDIQELTKRNKRNSWNYIQNEALAQQYILEKKYPRAAQTIFELDDSRLQQKLLKMVGKKLCRKNEFLGLYEILSTSNVKVPITFAPVNDFFAKLIAIGLVAEATKIDSSEFQTLRERMYNLLGKHKKLSEFCIQWSIVLLNFQIRNGTNEVTPRQKFEMEALFCHQYYNNNLASELVAEYFIHEELRTSQNDLHVRSMWNRLPSETQENIHINLLLGSPESAKNLPKYMQISDKITTTVEMFKMMDPDAKKAERNLRKSKKVMKREFKNYTKSEIKLERNKIKGSFQSSLREIFLLAPIVYLVTGDHEGGTELLPGMTSEPAGDTPVSEAELDQENEKLENLSAMQSSTATAQGNSEPAVTIDNEIQEEVLLNDFAIEEEVGSDLNLGTERWNELVSSSPMKHLETAKRLIASKEFESHIDQRTHLLECVDECLSMTGQDIKPHHKFVVMLAVEELARDIEQNSELIGILPPSTKESIRLFKEQNKSKILESGTPYCMRVLN